MKLKAAVLIGVIIILSNSTSANSVRSLGFENQFTSRAFWRIGYNSDHPSAGLTIPVHQYADLDLALDLEKDNSKLLWGINFFRNTENKRVNSNHYINFGQAVIGEDKFINIDHLGAGESDKPDYYFNYTVAEQAELINELLNRIGIKEASLLGYCYGGSICFYLAGNYPEKYNTIPPSDKFRPGALKMRHDVEFLSSYLVRDYVTFNFRLLYPYFNGKMWYQLNKDVLYIDLREDVRNLKAPVLYWAGTKSWAYDFLRPTKDYLKANVKDLKFIEIKGAEHEVDSFNRKRFMKEILEFLGEQ